MYLFHEQKHTFPLMKHQMGNPLTDQALLQQELGDLDGVGRGALGHTTHSTVKQYVAREKYCEMGVR